MVAYIQKVIDDILLNAGEYREIAELGTRVAVLVEEINRLDPRDFLPADQFDFVDTRRQFRRWNGLSTDFWSHLQGVRDTGTFVSGCRETAREATLVVDGDAIKEMLFGVGNPNCEAAHEQIRLQFLEACKRLRIVLNSYCGKDSKLIRKQFGFVSKAELRKIVERDYFELSMILFPSGAWKSTVVMAGSILEAILYDQLTKDQTRIAAAMASPKAPKKAKGVTRDITSDKMEDDWKLSKLIDVATDLKIIAADRSNTIDQTLREFRNFVHALVEIQSGIPLKEAEALLAKGALEAVCDQL